MGKKMTLGEICENLSHMNPDETIYAKEPWKISSVAQLFPDEEDLGKPPEATDLGLSYFLEISIAIEVAYGYELELGRKASIEELCERLIYYAAFDA